MVAGLHLADREAACGNTKSESAVSMPCTVICTHSARRTPTFQCPSWQVPCGIGRSGDVCADGPTKAGAAFVEAAASSAEATATIAKSATGAAPTVVAKASALIHPATPIHTAWSPPTHRVAALVTRRTLALALATATTVRIALRPVLALTILASVGVGGLRSLGRLHGRSARGQSSIAVRHALS